MTDLALALLELTKVESMFCEVVAKNIELRKTITHLLTLIPQSSATAQPTPRTLEPSETSRKYYNRLRDEGKTNAVSNRTDSDHPSQSPEQGTPPEQSEPTCKE